MRSLPGPQGRLLFAYFVLHPGRAVTREELIEAIWPGTPPENPRAALRTLLSRVRSALPDGTLVGGEVLELALPADRWIDVEFARAAADGAARAAGEGDAAGAVRSAQQALEILDDELLNGLDAPWLTAHRAELRELRVQSAETLAAAALASDGHLAPSWRRVLLALVEEEPYRESAHVLLMEALAADGNLAHALMLYDRLRLRLRDDLGAAPGGGARELHQRLLRAQEGGPGALSLPLPSALEQADARPFVGRMTELRFAEERLGAGGLAFVAGDAGVGKTRLAARSAARARQRGSTVLYGECNEEPLLPFEPFVTALRPYVLACPTEVLRRQTADHSPEVLVRVFPELGERLPDLTPAPEPGSATERYALFEAIAGLLSLVGGEQPALLVLDDLHWADRSSVQLLAHLERRAPVAILATYRQSEVTDDHPLLALLMRLRAGRGFERLDLGGLAEREVAQLVEAWSGSHPDEGFSQALHRKTAGNPFYVSEVLRQLSAPAGPGALASGPELLELGVPEGVKEVIGRRLSGLSSNLKGVLSIAAVAGADFHPAAVESLSPLSEEQFLDALDEGVRARLLVEAPDGEGLSFSHMLIRETLYEGLTRTRRQRLHARIAAQLERLEDLDPFTRASALAHHHLAAGRAGETIKAARHARAAGDLAAAALAYEDAVRYYERALEALADADPDLRARWEITMGIGSACIRAGGNERGRSAFAAAVELARELGDPECLARAALGFGSGHGSGVGVEWGVPDATLVGYLEEASAALPPRDSPLRARILARLALALYFVGNVERTGALSAQATEMAARIGDMQTLAMTLSASRGALWGTDDLERRLAATAEIRRLAEQVGDEELCLQGHFWAVIDFAERGDMAAVDVELDAFAAIARGLLQPVYLWYVELFGAMRRLLDWDLEGRRRHMRAAIELGMRMNDPNLVQGAGVQLLYLRREQGRIAETEAAIAGLAEQYDTVRGWWGLLAFVHAELGRAQAARAALERLPEDLSSLPRDANWLPTMAYIAEACALLGDESRAHALQALLAPYAERNVIVGPAVVCLGSLSRQLGLLAATTGRTQQARAHLQAALDAHTAMGARALLARTRFDYARVLLQAGGTSDRALAAQLLGASHGDAVALGMPRLTEQASTLMAASGMIAGSA